MLNSRYSHCNQEHISGPALWQHFGHALIRMLTQMTALSWLARTVLSLQHCYRFELHITRIWQMNMLLGEQKRGKSISFKLSPNLQRREELP